MFADYHIHSEFSDDSTEPMEKIVQRAIAIGMDDICFTDHVDLGVHPNHDDPEEFKARAPYLNVDYPVYFAELKRLREKYLGQILIKRGLEFGMQIHTIDGYQKLFDSYEMDFVILSCHEIEDLEFWNDDYQAGKLPDEIDNAYYQEILGCMHGYKDYSVLGHLDVIQRYNESGNSFEKNKEIITEILSQAIAEGKGIEVNTSSFRYGLPDLTPERKILRLYYDLGGKILTLGSDCHKAKDLGNQFTYIRKELRKMGFRYFCTFEEMEPDFHDLV